MTRHAFFQVPLFFMVTVVFAGFARLASVALNGRGSFECIYAICAVGMTLPMLIVLWFPETLLIVFFPDRRLNPLGGFGAFPLWLDVAR